MSTVNISRFEALFDPLALGSLHLPNRIVMAPMTRRQSPGGVPGRAVADYYTRRAAGGVGLIITEGTYIDHPVAGGYIDVPHIFGAAALQGWRRVIDQVHAAGSLIAIQLWHLGNVRQGDFSTAAGLPSIGPERVVSNGVVMVEALTDHDARDIAASFARAALAAVEIGFDAIELHGAHGYLLDQFQWPQMNRRVDGYGGSLEHRLRLSIEVTRAVKAAIGPAIPMIYRFSQWKVQDYNARIVASTDELKTMLLAFVAAGIDIFDVSTRRFWEPAFPDEGDVDLASLARQISRKPVIAVGSIGVSTPFSADQVRGTEDLTVGIANLELAAARLESARIDAIALGRALLSDPQWPAKVRSGDFDRIVPYRTDMFSRLA